MGLREQSRKSNPAPRLDLEHLGFLLRVIADADIKGRELQVAVETVKILQEQHLQMEAIREDDKKSYDAFMESYKGTIVKD
jgi:hypothetical protein